MQKIFGTIFLFIYGCSFGWGCNSHFGHVDYSHLDHLDASHHPTLSEKIRGVLKQHYGGGWGYANIVHAYSSGHSGHSSGGWAHSNSHGHGDSGSVRYQYASHNDPKPSVVESPRTIVRTKRLRKFREHHLLAGNLREAKSDKIGITTKLPPIPQMAHPLKEIMEFGASSGQTLSDEAARKAAIIYLAQQKRKNERKQQ